MENPNKETIPVNVIHLWNIFLRALGTLKSRDWARNQRIHWRYSRDFKWRPTSNTTKYNILIDLAVYSLPSVACWRFSKCARSVLTFNLTRKRTGFAFPKPSPKISYSGRHFQGSIIQQTICRNVWFRGHFEKAVGFRDYKLFTTQTNPHSTTALLQ